MPKGTKVDKIYRAIKGKYPFSPSVSGDEIASGTPVKKAKAKAAAIAQAKTGKSLATGKKPKGKK